jgi:hypothetical protein
VKKYAFRAILILSLLINLALFFRVFDVSLENDDMRSHSRLQRNELHFLAKATEGVLKTCKVSADEFDAAVLLAGRKISWNSDETLVGPFLVKKKSGCIVELKPVDGM